MLDGALDSDCESDLTRLSSHSVGDVLVEDQGAQWNGLIHLECLRRGAGYDGCVRRVVKLTLQQNDWTHPNLPVAQGLDNVVLQAPVGKN